MTATITKPEIQMIFAEEVVKETDGTYTLKNPGQNYGWVGAGNYFTIYYEIGPMEKQLYSYRIVLLSLTGETLAMSDMQEAEIDKYGLMGLSIYG